MHAGDRLNARLHLYKAPLRCSSASFNRQNPTTTPTARWALVKHAPCSSRVLSAIVLPITPQLMAYYRANPTVKKATNGMLALDSFMLGENNEAFFRWSFYLVCPSKNPLPCRPQMLHLKLEPKLWSSWFSGNKLCRCSEPAPTRSSR